MELLEPLRERSQMVLVIYKLNKGCNSQVEMYQMPVTETGYLFKRPIAFLHGHAARPHLPASLQPDGVIGVSSVPFPGLIHTHLLRDSPFTHSPTPSHYQAGVNTDGGLRKLCIEDIRPVFHCISNNFMKWNNIAPLLQSLPQPLILDLLEKLLIRKVTHESAFLLQQQALY